MPSVSSLLKSAQATKNKIREQEDAQIAFDYSQSAKTSGDFETYSKYLNSRMNEESGDPTKHLSLQKSLSAARNGFISNEIQRSTIDVIEGRSDNRTKYQRMTELFYQAVDAGNYDLAQGLNLQLDNLSLKIQREEQDAADAQQAAYAARQRSYGAMAASASKSLTGLINKLENGGELIELPNGKIVKPIEMLKRELKTTGGSQNSGQAGDFFREAFNTVEAMTDALLDAYNGSPDQEAADKIWNNDRYRALLQGEGAFDFGGTKLGLNDLELAYRSADANNPIWTLKTQRNETTGNTEYKLKMNKVDDFTWIRQDDGSYTPISVRTSYDDVPNQQLNTKLTDKGEVVGTDGAINLGTGKVDEKSTIDIKQRLANLGIQATAGDNGKIMLAMPGDLNYEATIMPDGSVRYFGQDGELYEISLFDKENFYGDGSGVKAGESRKVAPDEISIFGQQSAFGGWLSKPSAEGNSFMDELIHPRGYEEWLGSGDPTLKGSPLQRITSSYMNNTATGKPIVAPALQGGARSTSTLLQGANFTSRMIQQAEAARLQAAQAQLQSNVGVGLNQMPVAQRASNGAPIKQLRVTPLPPQPRLKVALPPPPRKVTVQPLPPQPRLSVQPLPPQPRVVVR